MDGCGVYMITSLYQEKLQPTIKDLENFKRIKSSSERLYSSVAILHTQSNVSVDATESPGDASVHLYPLRVTCSSVGRQGGLENTIILLVHPGEGAESVEMRGWTWEVEGEEVSGFHTGLFPGLQVGGEGVTTQVERLLGEE